MNILKTNLMQSPRKWSMIQSLFYIMIIDDQVKALKCASAAWFREGNGTLLQYSCLENPMDGGAWWAAVHGVAKSRTGLSDFTFPFHFHALEKEMATHSSVLAWRIPGTGEPGGLPSMGSHRVGHYKQLSSSSSRFLIHYFILHSLLKFIFIFYSSD